MRHRHLADLCTVCALFYCWIYLGFGICGGDLRMGYLCGMLLGFGVCIYTVGKWLQGLFRRFWWLLGRIFRLIYGVLQKILGIFKKIAKVLFAFHKK
jgi:hypothetical protein